MTEDEVSSLTKGTRINHTTLGDGTVADTRGPEGDRRLVADFDECGQKELLIAFAHSRVSLL